MPRKDKESPPAVAGHLVPVKVIAAMLGCTTRHVMRQVDLGMPVAQRGKGRAPSKFDIRAVHEWDKRRELNRQLPAEDRSRESEELRLITERADRLALENEVERRSLLKVEDAQELAMTAVAQMASNVKGLSGLACELAAESRPAICREILVAEGRRILGEFSAAMDQLGN